MAKTISVIIATYNAEVTIKDCLDSIYRQELSDIEILILDGASSDDTIAIINAHPLKCRIVSEKDEGIYDAWNTGVGLAEGDWLMFVGADDVVTAGLFETLKFEIRKLKLGVNYISGQNKMMTPDGEFRKFIGSRVTKKNLTRNMTAAHVGSLHHKSLFQFNGLFNTAYKIAGDYEFLLRNVDRLVPKYLPLVFCEAKIGGVSYSFKAIFEADRVRMLHFPQNFFRNKILLVKYLIVFSLIKCGIKQ